MQWIILLQESAYSQQTGKENDNFTASSDDFFLIYKNNGQFWNRRWIDRQTESKWDFSASKLDAGT